MPSRGPARTPRAHGRLAAGAHTLVELVVSVAITSIVLGALTAAVVFVSRALPEQTRAADQVRLSQEVADQIVGELECAVYVLERAARAVTFLVPDRNGDGAPERIRYAWTGVAGDPLTRQYNAGTAVTLLSEVQDFTWSYDVSTQLESYTGLPLDSPELLVSSYTSSFSPKDYNVDGDHLMAQYFVSSVAESVPNMITWRVTHARFVAKQDGPPDGEARIQIRTANADGTPTTTVLDDVPLSEASLPTSYGWTDVAFGNATGLGPSDALCLVLAYGRGGGNIMKARYENAYGWGRSTTSNAGRSWTYDTARSMYYCIYGIASIPAADQTATRYYVTGARLTLRAGDDAGAAVGAAARLLNAPEILSAVWESDFDANPIGIDANADGQMDWMPSNGPPLTGSAVSGGVWTAGCTLRTYPVCDFTGLTTVDVRLRDATVAGGTGAGVRLNVDYSAGLGAVIFASATRQADNTQTVAVRAQRDASTTRTFLTLTGLTDTWIDLRFVVDPVLDTVNVRVNGTDRGTFAYERFAGSGLRCVELYPGVGEDGAQFDRVRVRVGGTP